MTLEETFWQMFMIPGDLDDPAHDYSGGIFGLQISTRPAADAPAAARGAAGGLRRWLGAAAVGGNYDRIPEAGPVRACHSEACAGGDRGWG
jgi:hypothetical protein